MSNKTELELPQEIKELDEQDKKFKEETIDKLYESFFKVVEIKVNERYAEYCCKCPKNDDEMLICVRSNAVFEQLHIFLEVLRKQFEKQPSFVYKIFKDLFDNLLREMKVVRNICRGK